MAARWSCRTSAEISKRGGYEDSTSAGGALAGAASIALAGPAWAEPLERGTFHDEFTDLIDDFCDVPVSRCS
jgi:hypothetical protein